MITAPIDTMSFEAKPLLLDVVRTERQRFYDLVDDPANWEAQTRCDAWQVRDLVGHMIDVTEGYLDGWEVARSGAEAPAALGLLVMGETLDERARTHRALPREQAIERLKDDSERMLAIFDALTEQEWSGFMVPHTYMGPLPTLFYPAFHVMDYGVHTYDIRYGLGDRLARLDERTAGVLVPYMFVLAGATVDAESAHGVDVEYGIEVTGEWGGRWRVTVRDGKFEHKPETGDFEGAPARFTYDPSDFVLTSFKRFPGGSASGDPAVIEKVRNLFFAI